MSTFATIAVCVLAVMKVASFGFVVRSALRPPPIGRTDMDGPDDNWRWWEEFGPEPEPPSPGGETLHAPTATLKKTRSGVNG